MALDALWAVLIPEVSQVSQVSGSEKGGPRVVGIGGADTPDTPRKNVRYQPEPAWALGCTLDTPDTPEKINTEAHAANDLLLGELSTAEPPTNPEKWRELAQAYHAHHFKCVQCQAAGRGAVYGRRCAVGLALWSDYK